MSNILYIEIIINNKYYHIKENDKINDIIRIIRYWPLKNFSNYKLESERYQIKIFSHNEITEYTGQGKYPKGYFALKNLIGDSNA